MFCYQPKFSSPCYEVSREKFGELFDSPNTRWLVESHREIKDALTQWGIENADTRSSRIADPAEQADQAVIIAEREADRVKEKWLGSTEFQKFRARESSARRKGAQFAALDARQQLLLFAESLKKSLPAVMFQAREFDVTQSVRNKNPGRWRRQSAVRLSGLVVIDADHVKDVSYEYEKVLNEALNYEGGFDELGIVLIYVSPGGHGLKIVFKARTEWGNLIDNQLRMASILKVTVDESCKDASRMSFVSRREDILYINENELFNYENHEFSEKYEPLYRGNDSRPTVRVLSGDHDGADTRPDTDSRKGAESDALGGTDTERNGGLRIAPDTYHGVAYAEIIDNWLGGRQPEPGDRHRTSLALASDLRYITDNDAALIERLLRETPFVKEIVEERGEDVAQTVRSAMGFPLNRFMPKKMQEAVDKSVKASEQPEDGSDDNGPEGLPLASWGGRIASLMEHYPCMAEVCRNMKPEARPAALFTAAALFGTLMTRTWYYFYDRPDTERRLNYCVLVIGDPASGKSFANRLYDLIAAPIRVADQVGYEAINRYKEEVKERGTSSKAQKGEALKKPVVIIRDHPSRTSNATFIMDMNNAVEDVTVPTGDPKAPTAIRAMHLHLLTFDSELDNSTLTQKGGAWISKEQLELKAFHNETDGQAYSNLDSVSGLFNVYWNFVYTGTPLALKKKVNAANFGNGLATRLAVIPLPPTHFRMMELKRTTESDLADNRTIKEWAYRLDRVAGALPLWPLVEETHQWATEQMAVAAANASQAQEMLLKRVPYYGIAIAAPFILMRHWEQWKENATFDIDQKDLDLCRLVMEIQFECQLHFFNSLAEAYFEEERGRGTAKIHKDRFHYAFTSLKNEFTIADIKDAFGVEMMSAYGVASRLLKENLVTRVRRGTYRKNTQ